MAQEARCKNIFQNAAENKNALKRRLANISTEETEAQKKAAILKQQQQTASDHLEFCQTERRRISEQIRITREVFEEKKQTLQRHIKDVQSLERLSTFI